MTKTYTIETLRNIVSQNQLRAGTATCIGMSCSGVCCSTCPMVCTATGNGTFKTLSEARRSLARQEEVLKDSTPVKYVAGVSPREDPAVKQPSHYQVFDGLESISVIARTMTVEQFKGFCLGNVLKYRLRAGKKSDQANVTKDLAKAEFYKELFEKHKGECYEAK